MPPSNPAPPAPPAHKHSHHLHTIPPRQKSTRTLILDHMLWLHARTRFSQARAELGLPDLDININTNDDREETWVDVDAENRDGHLVQQSCRDGLMASLRYRSAPHPEVDEMVVGEELSRADHVQARALRKKADGLEKVLSAIMDQCYEPPPSLRPRSLDLEYPTLPSSFSRDDLKVQPNSCVLPNGIRIRLAVGALINILFSRADDPLSFDSTTSIPRVDSNFNVSCIPSSLLPLCLSATGLANAHAQVVGNGPALTDLAIFNTPSRPLDIASWVHHTAESSRGGSISTESLTSPKASSRDKDLYACGVQRPAPFSHLPESIHHSVRLPIRCTRHLVLGCMACPIQPSSATSIGSGLSRRPDGRPFRKIASDAKRENGGPKSIDLPPSHSSAPRSRLVDFLPLFLQLSALLAIELANEPRRSQFCTKVTPNNSITATGTSEPGSPYLSSGEYIMMDIVHNREGSNNSDPCTISKDGGTPSTSMKERRRTFPFSSLIGPGSAGTSYREPKSSVSSQLPTAPASAVPRYHQRVGPTSEWYALFAGLLTRAVLEGYLLKGWKGTWAAETLLSLGLSDSLRRGMSGEKAVSNIFELVEGEPPTVNELDPDDLPSVLEAGRILFGGHSAMVEENGQTVELKAQEEFALEMHKRMNEFLSIPPETPDLTAHLERLSQKYAAEPVEHAALRFLESVETWRGNPELETYKPNTSSHLLAHSRTSSAVLSPSPSLASIASIPQGNSPPDRPPTPAGRDSISSTPPDALSTPTDASQLQAIDLYFTVCIPKSKTRSPKSSTVAKQSRSGAGERWSVFSLGSKRPRDVTVTGGQDDEESTTTIEEERSSKKINTTRTA